MHENAFIHEYKSFIVCNIRDIVSPRKDIQYKIRPSTFYTDKIVTKKCFFPHRMNLSPTALIKRMDVKGKMNGTCLGHP